MKTLWTGGTIYTMAHEQETVEAILVEGSRILATGTRDQLAPQAEEWIDLQGATMYPGFVDSHLHMMFHGQKLQRVDLSVAKSADEMLALIREAANNTAVDQWLLADGWNENNFSDHRIPHKDELDALFEGPMIVTRICHHVVLCNSKALELAGITNETTVPAGGAIGRDECGQLNGLLYDLASNLATDALPREGEAYIQSLADTLQLTVDDMLARGLTGAHTEELHYFGQYKNALEAYQRVIEKNANFRVHLLQHHMIFEKMREDQIEINSPFLELGAMKIFADGAFGGSTAALLEPYADQPTSRGLLIHTDEQFDELVRLARAHEQAIAVHIIGDAAMEQVLDAIEKYPVPLGKRDRLIHCCLVTEEQLARMKKLSVILDLQPAFVPSDFPWVQERLGEDRMPLAYAWKTFIDNDLICAAGTDAPIEAIDPLATIYAAVERKKLNDTHGGYLPAQKLTRFEAIKMYTYGSAQAICQEHARGLIRVGYLADFTVFDRDLFAGAPEEILKARVVMTIVDGRVVYKMK